MADTFAAMHRLPGHLKELYFTPDHEWIRFEGSVASAGLSFFKLTGYRKISAYFLTDQEGMLEAGTPIASFEYGDYAIDMQMPVKGRILGWNRSLLDEPASIMLDSINQFTWIARIMPAMPFERSGLQQAVHYQPLHRVYGLQPQ